METPGAAGSSPQTARAGGPKRILAVINPVSGPLSSRNAGKELAGRAGKLGVKLECVETTPRRDGLQAVRSMEGPYDCYLVWGGDGTVMEVVAAAIEDGVPIAIIPRGTANAVAWHFGIPFDLGRAFPVAVQGKPVRIDVARTRDRNFLIMAGLGFDALMIQSATRSLKRRLGFLAYLYAALKNLGRRAYTYRVTLNGGEPFRIRGAMAAIANTGTFAGNIRPVRPVSPLDGLLDLIVVSPENFRDFFRILVWGMLGRLHEDPRVRHFRAERIRVETRPLAPLEIDGDEVAGMHREVEVEILPQALTVLVPAEGKLKLPWLPEVPWPPPGLPAWMDPSATRSGRSPGRTGNAPQAENST